MERFKQRQSLAGTLQPGDATRYEMVAVRFPDTVEVIVINDGFFDNLTFLTSRGRFGDFYRSFRGEKTNPWTIKAAKEMFDMLTQESGGYCCICGEKCDYCT